MMTHRRDRIPSPRSARLTLAALMAVVAPTSLTAQAPWPAGQRGSANVDMVEHIELGAPFTAGDVEIEQELARPFAYASRWTIGGVDDMERFLAGDEDQGLIGRVEVPENPCPKGGLSEVWHDFYVAYHPASGQDRFYGASQHP